MLTTTAACDYLRRTPPAVPLPERRPGRNLLPRPSPARLEHLRRQVAGGTYLAEHAEEKLVAAVEGLLRELLIDGPGAQPRRVAG